MVYGRKAHFSTDRGKTVCIQSVLHARELFFASAFPVDFPLAVVFAEECRLFVERATLSAVNRGEPLGFLPSFSRQAILYKVLRPCFS